MTSTCQVPGVRVAVELLALRTLTVTVPAAVTTPTQDTSLARVATGVTTTVSPLRHA